MRIVQLTAENFKRLRAVDITPDGHLQVVAGRNAQGKTSVLDAIWHALGGGAAARSTTRPVRDGEKSAEVRLDLGDLVVTRRWSANGTTTLRVASADGASYSSPQRMLDDLVGRLSFDPLAFAETDARTQLSTLLELVDLPFNPEELAAERQGLYEQRTLVGRDVKAYEGQLAGMPVPPEGLPETEASVSALIAEVTAKRDKQRRFEGLLDKLADTDARLVELDAQIAELTRRRDKGQEVRVELQRQADAAPEPEDLSAYEERIDKVEETNTAVRAAARRREVETLHAAATETSTALTAQIAALDESRAAGMRAARMPVAGMGFDDDGVTFDGIPFKQCSAAEQLRVSMAMAMAMNPKLRVIRITDGSLLDSENLRLVEQMATDADFQVWLERVDESGSVGVLIEDGAVAADASKAVTA